MKKRLCFAGGLIVFFLFVANELRLHMIYNRFGAFALESVLTSKIGQDSLSQVNMVSPELEETMTKGGVELCSGGVANKSLISAPFYFRFWRFYKDVAGEAYFSVPVFCQEETIYFVFRDYGADSQLCALRFYPGGSPQIIDVSNPVENE